MKMTPLLMMMVVGAVVPLGVVGQLAGQGVVPRQDECFPGEGPPRQMPTDPAFVRVVERFSYFLFNEIAKQHPGQSLILSPYSVWSVLTLAYFGAMGITKAEMENALAYANKTHTLSNWIIIRDYLESGADSATLNVANRGYFSQRLELNRCLANELFDLRIVDFVTNADAARRAINHDVSITTQGLIPELIQFLPPSTRFALVNAIFFKGTWANEFNASLTKDHQFMVPPGRSSGSVKMMKRVAMMTYGEAAGLDAKMVELPYKDSNMSMYLLLPNDPLAPITDLTSRLTAATFVPAVRSLPSNRALVELFLPKFKMSTQYDEKLKTALITLGVSSLFDPRRSDLSGFATTRPPLYVDDIIHKATVEVNEEGTVAAAATAAINTRIGPQKPIRVLFNRPFVFLIVEKTTRIPLFMGQVTSARDLQ